MTDDFAHHLDDGDRRPADLQGVAVAQQQDVRELDRGARLDLAVIDRHLVAWADAILPRAVGKYCIHR